jgi:hypothetical protein
MDDEGNPVARAIGIVAIWTRICIDAPLSLSDVGTLFAPTGEVIDKTTISVSNLLPISLYIIILKDDDTMCTPYLSANKAWWILTEEVVT